MDQSNRLPIPPVCPAGIIAGGDEHRLPVAEVDALLSDRVAKTLSAEIVKALFDREKFPWSVLVDEGGKEVAEQAAAKGLYVVAANSERAENVIVALPNPRRSSCLRHSGIWGEVNQ